MAALSRRTSNAWWDMWYRYDTLCVEIWACYIYLFNNYETIMVVERMK